MKTLNQLSNEGIKFVVIKKDETNHWHNDIQAKAKKIWTVCLVDLTQPTNLCEISVSYPYEEIKHFFEDIAEGLDENDICEHEYIELGNGYFGGSAVFTIEREYNDERDFEEVMENEQCNPTIC